MAETPTERGGPSGWRLGAWIIAGAVGVGVGGLFTFQQFRAPPEAPDKAAATNLGPRLVDEFEFQVAATKNFAEGDVLAEWRAARSDHKIIALTIASCKGIGDADVMPHRVFSALRLDLWPDGNHYVHSEQRAAPVDGSAVRLTANQAVGGDGDPASRAIPPTPPAAPLHLSAYQQQMIVFSDAAARARLSAADGATSNYPRMNLFGWYTVIISGLATLLITLKASMNPRETRKPGEPIKWRDFDTLRNGLIVFLGIAAIVCSTAGTVLNGVKQFYDPTQAYNRNTTALVKARKLHQEIILSFVSSWDADKCGSATLTQQQVKDWSGTMADLQQQILKAAVSIPGLDAAAASYGPAAKDQGSQRRDTTAPAQTDQDPPPTPIRARQNDAMSQASGPPTSEPPSPASPGAGPPRAGPGKR